MFMRSLVYRTIDEFSPHSHEKKPPPPIPILFMYILLFLVYPFLFKSVIYSHARGFFLFTKVVIFTYVLHVYMTLFGVLTSF